MPKKTIDLVQGLIEPLSWEIRESLEPDLSKKRYSDFWTRHNTVYEAMQSIAQMVCRRSQRSKENPSGLVNYQECAIDAVTRTCVLICEIAQRDGRRRVTDKRRSMKKPKFTDHRNYVQWVMARLQFVIKDIEREQLQRANKKELQFSSLRGETQDALGFGRIEDDAKDITKTT